MLQYMKWEINQQGMAFSIHPVIQASGVLVVILSGSKEEKEADPLWFGRPSQIPANSSLLKLVSFLGLRKIGWNPLTRKS